MSSLIENLLGKRKFWSFWKKNEYFKNIYFNWNFDFDRGRDFLIQKRETPETKIPEKKEIRIETKEEFY